MPNKSRWPTVAALLAVTFANGCVDSQSGESATTSSGSGAASGESATATSSASGAAAQSAPLMTVNQLMHAILFPLGNAVFYAQTEDPDALPRDPQPSSSPNPLTGLYGGWQAVENSALGLAESADLLLIAGRTCSNGETVNVQDADWIRFVEDYRAKSVAAYEAALTKDQDAMVEASGYLYDTCSACHRVYRREPIRGDPSERCIPGAPATPR